MFKFELLALTVIRDRIAGGLGVAPQGRAALVQQMIERHSRDRVNYWLQLGLSTAISTLGLVLGSTGVVIGAMLISPLMSPLVELGMGLAIGSPVLFARSFTRTMASVLVVVGSAALMTLALPFQQVTAEIAARTSPTVLDLLVAACCALAAAYTTVRSTSDTTTAAAGTAIGIALVPPLCVGGFGIGAGFWTISAGALLLFTANFSAIVLVSVVSFLLLGFDRVPVHELEHHVIESGTKVTLLGRWVHALFGSRYSGLLRLLLPALLAAAVYVPLRRALAEVSWEVRVRSGISQVLDRTPLARSAIRSSIVVEQHSVSLRLAIVGGQPDASRLEAQLGREIQALAGVEPTVEVTAVPDASSLRQLAQAQHAMEGALKKEHQRPLAETVRSTLDELWPTETAGPLLEWRIATDQAGESRVTVVHLGDAIGPSGVRLLQTELQRRAGVRLKIEEKAHSRQVQRAERPDAAWMLALFDALEAARGTAGLRACVTLPPASERNDVATTALVQDAIGRMPPQRAEVRDDASWSVWLANDGCRFPEPEGSGAPDAGSKQLSADQAQD